MHDTGALWAIGRLQERGITVDVVTAPALGAAERWEHRIIAAGPSFEIKLRDGRTLSSAETRGVLNRLTYVPSEQLSQIAGEDYGYAVQEMQALFLSWLNAMPGPVLNRPAPQGLGGAWRHPSAWAALAWNAGLRAATWRESSDTPAPPWSTRPVVLTAFVVHDTVVAPPEFPDILQDGCRRLACLAGTALLGIDFGRREDGEWEVTGASPMPDLARGGSRLADALAEGLTP